MDNNNTERILPEGDGERENDNTNEHVEPSSVMPDSSESLAGERWETYLDTHPEVRDQFATQEERARAWVEANREIFYAGKREGNVQEGGGYSHFATRKLFDPIPLATESPIGPMGKYFAKSVDSEMGVGEVLYGKQAQQTGPIRSPTMDEIAAQESVPAYTERNLRSLDGQMKILSTVAEAVATMTGIPIPGPLDNSQLPRRIPIDVQPRPLEKTLLNRIWDGIVDFLIPKSDVQAGMYYEWNDYLRKYNDPRADEPEEDVEPRVHPRPPTQAEIIFWETGLRNQIGQLPLPYVGPHVEPAPEVRRDSNGPQTPDIPIPPGPPPRHRGLLEKIASFLGITREQDRPPVGEGEPQARGTGADIPPENPPPVDRAMERLKHQIYQATLMRESIAILLLVRGLVQVPIWLFMIWGSNIPNEFSGRCTVTGAVLKYFLYEDPSTRTVEWIPNYCEA